MFGPLKTNTKQMTLVRILDEFENCYRDRRKKRQTQMRKINKIKNGQKQEKRKKTNKK